MNSETYTVRLSAVRKCRFCLVDFVIHSAEPLIGTPLMIGLGMAEAIEEQMIDEGWEERACPTCGYLQKRQLHAEHHADNAREMMEVES